MKKIIIISMSVLISVLIGIRIHHVNSSGTDVPIYVYEKKEEVVFDKFYFSRNKEATDGYSINVLDTTQIKTNDFLEKYNINDEIDLSYADYICIVHAKIKNVSNDYEDRAGININRFILQNGAYIGFYNSEIYPNLNKHPDTQFSLAKGVEIDIYIPFALKNDEIKMDDFNSGNSYFIISLYPNKRMVKL